MALMLIRHSLKVKGLDTKRWIFNDDGLLYTLHFYIACIEFKIKGLDWSKKIDFGVL